MALPKIFKNSTLYTFVAFLQKGTSFLLLPFYTYYLTPKDYGILNVITSIASFLSLFFLLSLNGAASRFHFKYTDQLYIKKIWGTILIMVLFNSVILGGIFIVFHRWLVDPLASNINFYPLLFISILGTILSPLYLFFQQWLQCIQDAKKYAINLLSNFFIATLLNIISLSIFHQGVLGIVISTFITSVIFFIYSLIAFLPHIKLQFEKEIAKKAIVYSAPLVPHSVSGWLSVMLDRIMLNNMTNSQQVGFYSVASQFGSILYIITYSINQAFSPWFFEKMKKGIEELESIKQFALASNVACCYIAFIIVLFSPDLIGLMTSDAYHSSWQPVILICYGYVFNGLYFFFSKPLFLENTKYVMVISIIVAIVNILLNLLLIPLLGMIGAGLSFMFSQLISSLISLLLSIKKISILKFDWRNMYLTTFFFLSVSSIVFFCQEVDNFLLRITIKIVILFFISSVIALKYKSYISLIKIYITNKHVC